MRYASCKKNAVKAKRTCHQAQVFESLRKSSKSYLSPMGAEIANFATSVSYASCEKLRKSSRRGLRLRISQCGGCLNPYVTPSSTQVVFK